MPVFDATAEDVQAVNPIAVSAFVPAVRILDRRKRRLPSRTNGNSRTTFALSFEPLDPTILDGIFESGVPAIRAITVIALCGNHGLSDQIHLVACDEPHQVCQTRMSRFVAVAHAETTAHRHIVTHQCTVIHDTDEP